MARWADGAAPLVADYGSDDSPRRIGPIDISCYVLSDRRRVLSQRGLQGGLGLSRSGGKAGARRVAQFLASIGLKALIPVS